MCSNSTGVAETIRATKNYLEPLTVVNSLCLSDELALWPDPDLIRRR